MTLPFALNHINVWLLRDWVAAEGGAPAREGWSIVDCGIDDAATRAAWEELFASGARRPAGAARDRHPHAPRPHRLGALAVRALGRAPLDQRHRFRHRPHGEHGERRLRRAALGGLHGGARHGRRPEAALDGVASRTNYYRNLVPAVPAAYRRLLDGGTSSSARGDARADWTCHVGYGHAPEHMALALRDARAS